MRIKIHLALIIGILLIGIVSAESNSTNATIKIDKSILDFVAMHQPMCKIKVDLKDAYETVTVKSPVMEMKSGIMTAKTTSKVQFYINWSKLEIVFRTIQIPVYEDVQITKLKPDYSFDEDTGEITHWEKCK